MSCKLDYVVPSKCPWVITPSAQLLHRPKYSRVEKIKTIGSTYMAAAGLTKAPVCLQQRNLKTILSCILNNLIFLPPSPFSFLPHPLIFPPSLSSSLPPSLPPPSLPVRDPERCPPGHPTRVRAEETGPTELPLSSQRAAAVPQDPRANVARLGGGP